jgi:hypothetical protein
MRLFAFLLRKKGRPGRASRIAGHRSTPEDGRRPAMEPERGVEPRTFPSRGGRSAALSYRGQLSGPRLPVPKPAGLARAARRSPPFYSGSVAPSSFRIASTITTPSANPAPIRMYCVT